MKYSDAWAELKARLERMSANYWGDGVDPFDQVLDEMDNLESEYE